MTRHEIFTIFNPILAREARGLANIVPSARIIPVKDFPPGVAIHPDGSKRYNPRKPLAYFALELRSKRAIKEWARITRDYDRRADEDRRRQQLGLPPHGAV